MCICYFYTLWERKKATEILVGTFNSYMIDVFLIYKEIVDDTYLEIVLDKIYQIALQAHI